MAKALFFETPIFNKGQNVSVRRGTKWDGAKSAELVDASRPAKIISVVQIKTRVFRFCDLVDADIAAEHDERCRTVAGLGAIMQNIYPDFDRREIVTLIYFDYTPKE